jgi:hypothetical protein
MQLFSEKSIMLRFAKKEEKNSLKILGNPHI